jgi:hypothetical protein
LVRRPPDRIGKNIGTDTGFALELDAAALKHLFSRLAAVPTLAAILIYHQKGTPWSQARRSISLTLAIGHGTLL